MHTAICIDCRRVCQLCFSSPVVRRQEQLEKNMEEFREFTRSVSDEISKLKNKVSWIAETGCNKL